VSWLQRMRAHWRPTHPAILTDEQRLTYADLDARISRAAGWLAARGLQPGDIVALQMPRSLAFLELHLAALGSGLVTLPLNPTYPPAELRYYLQDSGARLAVVLPEHAPALADVSATVLPASDALRAELDAADPVDLPSALPDDTLAMVLYTSGTTGRPKGALLTHDTLRACVEALHQAWRWSPDDVIVHALPLFHVHGLFLGQHGALRAGATARWLPRFDAVAALSALQDQGGTIFMGVPTFYARFLALPPDQHWDLSGVRLFTSGSAPLPARDHQAFLARFGHTILERYGMTEVGIVLSNPYQGERRPGAVGFAVPGADVRVFDPETDQPAPPDQVGEVRISGPSVFQGYLGRPQATAQALEGGWMHSGDLGYVDQDGYIHLVGRSKDMVLSGGLNVYPSEVEAALLEHPAVASAAVVGVADPDLGERVVASVVLADDASAEPDALRTWCRDRVAPYKVPKAVAVVDALPRNAMGKVQKARLREHWDRIVVRRAQPSEADRIARWNVAMALETEGLALDPPTVLRGVKAVFAGDVGARYFVAERAGDVVGTCMITDEWSDWRARPVWWFQSVFVPRPWRRRGVFRAMYQAVGEAARQAGAGGLRLYVDKRNTGAMATYRSLGMDDAHYAMFEAMFDEPPSAP